MASVKIPNYLRETHIIQTRVVLSMFLVLVLSGILIYRLHNLQVENHKHFSTLSQNNRIDLRPVPPVRGLITDRNGVVLAQNFPIYNIELIPDQIEDMDALLNELGKIILLKPRELERFQRLSRRRPGFERRTLRTNVSDVEAGRFAVSRHRFPGVELRARLQRNYPLGALTGHILGYVGRISESDLESIDRMAYQGTEYIGKLGIESRYEDTLLGTVGFEQVETNAHGRVIRLLSRTSPTAGSDLRLNIDVRLQEVAEKALGEWKGSVVALEPQTGAVLAFVSKPGYDPNPFVNGIEQSAYQRLRQAEGRPLLNRALNGRYAPGSTIKGVMALAGLQHGISRQTTFFDPGWYSLPNTRHRYRCWKKSGHGPVDLHNSIVKSCDVYYYNLARQLGIRKIYRFFTDFGLGQQTGIDLEGEPSGLVPSPEWKRGARGQPWYPGETVITGIGQGYMLATPLQLAQAAATIANQGRRMKPQLVQAIGNPEQMSRVMPKFLHQVRTRQPDHFQIVIDAMTDVVHGQRGTARRIGKDSPYRIAGKTGTAQIIGIAQGAKYDEKKLATKFHDHALFIAFAPVEAPRIAVAVVAENGGGGSRTAAPIAKKVLDFYLLGES